MTKKEKMEALKNNYKDDEELLRIELFNKISKIFRVKQRDSYSKSFPKFCFSVNLNRKIVNFEIADGSYIHFEDLMELSKLLNTEEISISSAGEEYHEYSSHGISVCQEITCSNCDFGGT